MTSSERSFARRIDLTSLQLFVAVCELGSIGRAAEREFIAASAISKRLSDLEATLGTPLLYRHARGVDLTPAGESLLHHARSVLYSLEKMQGELSEYADGVRGHVRVHANISAIVQFLPEDLGAFTREHDAIKIDLEEHLSSEVVRAVQEGAADLGICHAARRHAANCRACPTAQDALVLIVPARPSRWPRRSAIDFADTLDFDHVGLHTNSSIYVAMHQAALAAGRTHQAAHPRHRPGRHVPHDRERPGRRRDAAARLRADARRHRPRPRQRGAERRLGARARSGWSRAISPPCRSRRACSSSTCTRRADAPRPARRDKTITFPRKRPTMARTLYDKIWDEHVVHTEEDGTAILYIDRHLVHEVTSPQAFEGLRAGRPQGLARQLDRGHRRPQHADHRLGARLRRHRRPDQQGAGQHAGRQHREFGAAAYFPFLNKRQGIVHVIGPEQGATLPGMTVVCGDSHTSTHGAFGALAHGIGTSEVEHVLATQTLLAKKAKNMLVKVEGKLPPRLHRQGHRAGHHRQDRHRRRHRLHDRVRRLGDPRAQHGRPHDGLQHGDRGRCARRPGGGGREDDRLRQGPPARAHAASSGTRPSRYWRTLQSDAGAHFDAVVELDAGADQAAGHLGHLARDGAARSTTACPIPTRKRTPTSATRSSAR